MSKFLHFCYGTADSFGKRFFPKLLVFSVFLGFFHIRSVPLRLCRPEVRILPGTPKKNHPMRWFFFGVLATEDSNRSSYRRRKPRAWHCFLIHFRWKQCRILPGTPKPRKHCVFGAFTFFCHRFVALHSIHRIVCARIYIHRQILSPWTVYCIFTASHFIHINRGDRNLIT